uniref:DUF1618 domain-containing protein n=1 Tax=Leersia perrieri TaxID=77586 RepID=A0A0D9XPK6_9ORYZ
MEAQQTQPATLPSGAGCYVPRWVLLEPDIQHKQKKGSEVVDDPRTEATCRNSAGHVITVAFCHVAPPAPSRLCISSSPCHHERVPDAKVIAAHGHSVLIELYFQKEPTSYEHGYDYFVYTAAGDTPPSLSLLPPRGLGASSTGLLVRRRRHDDDDDDIAVANLEVWVEPEPKVAELLVLRSGEWRITRRRIRHGKGKAEELSYWETDIAVPIGDRTICWVDLYRGVIICDGDVFDDKTAALRCATNPRHCFMKDRTVCVAGDTIKFVNIFPRCCCGNPAVTTCDHSSRAFVINTWTLRMDDMTWVKDGIVDSTEFWSLSTCAGLPQKKPKYPVVSIDDSHIICFVVSKKSSSSLSNTFWKIMLDTRSKTLLPVVRYNPSQQQWVPFSGKTYIPSKIFDYLTSDVTCSNNSINPAVIADIPATTTAIVGSSSRTLSHELSAMSLKGSEMVSPREILAALQEIPDLARADMLRSYSILISDDGRRFKSLLVLPMGLRKEWLLIEIKNSDKYNVCDTEILNSN